MIKLRHALVLILLLGLATERALGFDPDANERVNVILVQGDGKILIGGRFTAVGGTTRSHLARLNPDGSVDASFNVAVDMTVNPGTTNIQALAVQDDGKILVGGRFLRLGGETHSNIGRLNADGSVDQTFQPKIDGIFGGSVSSIAIQSDGKIVLGGQFTLVNGETRIALARLNRDGTLDEDFNPGATGINNSVHTLKIQPDGRILVGGNFDVLGGYNRFYFGRLNEDGSLDLSFNPPCDGAPADFMFQSGGRILVGGRFTVLANQPCNNLGRLTQDGQLDSTFNPSPNDRVYSLATQTDGKILVGGRFTSIGGQPIGRLARLNPDGSVDLSFKTQVELAACPGCAYAGKIVIQTDDRILVSGYFTTLAGAERNYIGRLHPDARLDAKLNQPLIASVHLIGLGQFQFSSTNALAASFSVLASTNLNAPGVTWENLGSPTSIGDGLYQFSDPGVANNAQRFYQLRSP